MRFNSNRQKEKDEVKKLINANNYYCVITFFFGHFQIVTLLVFQYLTMYFVMTLSRFGVTQDMIITQTSAIKLVWEK
jgi:hypothetical protein